MSQFYKMDNSRRAKQFAPFAALSGFEDHLENAEKIEYEIPRYQEKISTIVSISDTGKMIPLWYSYEGEKYKISEVIWSIDKPDWSQFRCAIHDNGIRKVIDIFFYKEITLWTLSV